MFVCGCGHVYACVRVHRLSFILINVIVNDTGKPTKEVLQRIVNLLPDKLTVHIIYYGLVYDGILYLNLIQSSDTSYSVTALAEQSAVMITAIYQPPLTVIATLTCTEMREQIDDEGIKGT